MTKKVIFNIFAKKGGQKPHWVRETVAVEINALATDKFALQLAEKFCLEKHPDAGGWTEQSVELSDDQRFVPGMRII